MLRESERLPAAMETMPVSTALTDEHKAQDQARPKVPHFLGAERALLERFLPGLDASLKAIPLGVLEGRENPSIRMLKDARGPRLLIPKKYGGLGARCCGGGAGPAGDRQPGSLAGDRLHDAQFLGLHPGRVGRLRRGVRRAPPVRPGRELDVPGLRFRRGPLRGQAPRDDHAGPAGARRRLAAERPEAALHPDLLHGLPDLRRERGDRGRGPTACRRPGPRRLAGDRAPAVLEEPRPRGAESDEVILNDVHVPDDFVFVVEGSDALDPVEVTGYIWLQLALSSTYLGIVSGLVERLLESGKGTPEERGGVVAQVEAQAAAVDGIAYAFDAGEDRERLLARALTVRFALQEAIESVAMRCAELLGGMAFIGGSDVAYLLCASRGPRLPPPRPPPRQPRPRRIRSRRGARRLLIHPRTGRDRPNPRRRPGPDGLRPPAHDTDPSIEES